MGTGGFERAKFLDWEAPRRQTMSEWQAGRCAICGDFGQLVLDHCHIRHMTRGYLCQSCNSVEGRGNNSPAFVEWRLGTNPATMYGWEEEMWGTSELIAEFYATDAETHADTMRRGAEAAGRIG